MGLILRAFHPHTGAFLGDLPDWVGVNQQIEENAEGVLTLSYPRSGINASIFDLDLVLLALVEDGVVSDEWYVYEEDQDDPSDEEGANRLIAASCRGYLSWLDRARVYPQEHNPGQTGIALNGQFPVTVFADKTPGEIMQTLIARASARGAIQGLITSFNATYTSNASVLWEKTHSVTYDAGIDYLTVVRALCDNGLCDVRTIGRQLHLYNPSGVRPNNNYNGSATVDRPNVILRLGRDVKDGSRKRSRRGIVSHMLGQGEERNLFEASDAAALAQYGRREGFESRGGITNPRTLQIAVNASLETASSTKEQITLTYIPAAVNSSQRPAASALVYPPLPGIDFKVGDFIRYDQRRISETELEPLKVKSITKSWAADGTVSIALTLNDLFVQSQVALTRRVNGIVNTAMGPWPPPKPYAETDTTTPSTPAGVTISSDTYLLEDGRRRGLASISWQPVLTNTDGSEYIDFGGYGVQWRIGTISNVWSGEVRVAENANLVVEDLPPGRILDVRVRAWDFNQRWSGEYGTATATLARDTIPVNQPSPPVLSSRLGVVKAAWNGLDISGTGMPLDFDYLEVHASAVGPTFTPTAATAVDRLKAAGVAVIPGLPYGSTQWVAFVAVDIDRNRSAVSEFRSVLVSSLVPEDVVGKVLDGANFKDFSVDGSTAVKAGSIDTTRLRVGINNLFVDPLFENADLRAAREQTGTNVITFAKDAAQAHAGHRYAVLSGPNPILHFQTVRGDTYYQDLIPGVQYRVSAWVKRGPTYVNGTVQPALRRLYTDGTSDYVFALPGLSPSPEWTLMEWVFTAPQNLSKFGLYLYFSNPTPAGNILISEPEMRPLVPGVLIENGAVTADRIAANAVTALKIAANAITADKIDVGAVNATHIAASAITADKIGTGTLTAQVTVSGRIKTALSGARVELDGNGLRAFNSSNQVTLSTTSADGSIDLMGTLMSGPSDRTNITLSSDASAGLPGLKWSNPANFAWQSKPNLFLHTRPGNDYHNALWMTSYENVANSSGRSQLILHPERWRLDSAFGTAASSASIYHDRLASHINVDVGGFLRFQMGATSVFRGDLNVTQTLRVSANVEAYGGLRAGKFVTGGGNSVGAGILNSGFNNEDIWFAWRDGFLELWVNGGRIARITGDGRSL